MSLIKCRFEDIVDFYDYMRIPVSTLERDKRRGEYPYYGAQGVIDSIDEYIFDGEYLLIAEDGANLVTRNQPIAQIAKGKFWVNNHAHIVQAKTNVSTNYFVSVLINLISISGYVTGAAQPKLSQKNLRQIPVTIPSYIEQLKITKILKSYDDLIENNRRRIQLLEESARLLYREWFVYLRFPGHELVKIVDGVPEGWELTTASAVMDVLSGGTPKTTVHEYWDGEIPFFTPRDTTDCTFTYSTEKTITESGLAKCNSRLYPKYTVFITARGTVGKLSFAQRPMAMNQSCYALIAKENISQQFLYCSLKSSIEQFKARASGSVFDSIVVDTFKQIPFLKPSETLLGEFTESALKVFEQVDKLSMMNIKLAEARDLLLPRLMNGEISV